MEHLLHPTSLYRDFLSAPERVRDFYPVDYRDLTSGSEHAAPSDFPAARRAQMAAILRRQASEIGFLDASRESLSRFERPNAWVVVAGQQPGLFGGPLYTLYKALTAVALARDVEAASGRPVVPIFWVASDDHDIEEVRRTWVSDGASEPDLLEYPPGGLPGGTSFARIRLGPEIDGLVGRVESLLDGSEFRGGVLEPLRAAYASGRCWSEAFGRFMAAFVAPLGALVFDPSDPEAKAVALPVFEREIALLGRSSTRAREVGEELVRRGYHAQIARAGNELNLFWHGAVREAVRVEGDGALRLAVTGRRLSRRDFTAMIRERPVDASPGVLLRPLVQDHLFPTVAYVGGPSEVAYWAQINALYPLFEARPPAITPRAGATLLEPKVAKVLDRLDITWSSLAGDVEARIGEILRGLLPEDFPEAFERERKEWRKSFHRLETKVVAFDPSLQSAVATAMGKFEHESAALERKLMQVWKRRQDELVQKIRRASVQLFPQGHLQERVHSPLGYAARYGPELVARLRSAIGTPGAHILIPLEGEGPMKRATVP